MLEHHEVHRMQSDPREQRESALHDELVRLITLKKALEARLYKRHQPQLQELRKLREQTATS